MSNQQTIQIQPTDKIELTAGLIEKLINIVGSLPSSQVGEIFLELKLQVRKSAEKIVAEKASEQKAEETKENKPKSERTK